jgi:hypothetical protein
MINRAANVGPRVHIQHLPKWFVVLPVRIHGLYELIELAFQNQRSVTMNIDHGNDRNIEVSKAMATEEVKTIVVNGELGGVVGDGLGYLLNHQAK